MTLNHTVRLMVRPIGEPTLADFKFADEPLPAITDGQMLVKNLYLSLDPAMRGWMNEGKSYIEPVGLGDVMRAGGIGQVLESKNAKFVPGDYVSGMANVQTYCVTDGKGWVKVDPNLAPLTTYLNVLGMPGMTAYFGLLESGQPKAGETVVVSGAAGAVGATVGQVAKIKGCRVVGIAGGAEKCRIAVEELGFDACIDYKNEDVRVGLKRECPNGIDVYFDNVGGEILDTVLTRINLRARIVICGAISQYNNTTPVKGPSNYLSLLVNRARMEGIVVFDYAPRYKEAALAMGAWLKEGKMKSKEHIEEGIDRFPEVLMKLFKGENFGKLVLKVG
ncbi:MAG: NADP-dependent oxidoreductase [Betaproteobacteria bacterium]|jgi:NADPH-dependent curcumin reductase CurA|nr:NADP-dependent oxidoreductase [Betaproteobacteria bacterium UKL13-2]HCG53754.1 NADP-dependent oxidoreductase [Betaproteobacteria bacterium]